jgi:hypothetical protein
MAINFNERVLLPPSEESHVQGCLAALTIVLLLGMVLTRVTLMRRQGTRVMHFGNLDKTDFRRLVRCVTEPMAKGAKGRTGSICSRRSGARNHSTSAPVWLG